MGQEFVATVEGAAVAELSLKQLHLLQPDAVQRSDDEWGDTVQLHSDEEEKPNFRFFVFQHSRYAWNPTANTFTRLGGLSERTPCKELHRMSTGLSREEQIERRKVFGPNIIDVPLKSYPRLLVEEILNPFYIFQILSVTLWMLERYYYYAVCIVIISAVSICVSLYETRKQSVTLRDMVRATVCVTVRRADGSVERVDSSDLVPGDCLLIPAGDAGGAGGAGDGDGAGLGGALPLPFDAALVGGSSCIVNESMLTGESVPVTKTALEPQEASHYSAQEHQRHTLFCGTSVIQAKPGAPHTGGAGGGDGGDGFACAVVTRTGFYTAKGELVRTILYPRPIRFRFYRDAVRFVLFLAVLAAIGDIYSIVCVCVVVCVCGSVCGSVCVW
ncbi:polyamine-transporting ATPase 13A2-like [Petromyzon marinus]|uniref:polyamine-transporting ATPase 13A2-like n=1 Tax=Petromyzon marinus TaxID=7757 RepID=UPI003F723EDF